MAAVTTLICLLGLCGCLQQESARSIGFGWVVTLNASARQVGVTPTAVVLDESRAFGDQLVALSVASGRVLWTRVASPTLSATVVGSRVITTQKLSSATLVSGFNAANGDELWQASFSTTPVAEFADGDALEQTTGGKVRTVSKGGVLEPGLWRPPHGCVVDSAARVPRGGSILLGRVSQ